MHQARVPRGRLHSLIASMPPRVVGMEACSGVHHLARLFQAPQPHRAVVRKYVVRTIAQTAGSTLSVITQFDGLMFTYRDGPARMQFLCERLDAHIPVRSVASQGWPQAGLPSGIVVSGIGFEVGHGRGFSGTPTSPERDRPGRQADVATHCRSVQLLSGIAMGRSRSRGASPSLHRPRALVPEAGLALAA